jgi:membrane-bound lytic murein transglycosylase B
VASILFYENRQWPSIDKYVCSPAAACGIAQFIPSTWARYGIDADGNGASRESWRDNIHSASNYIGKMHKSVREAAIEYNAGPSYAGASDGRLPKETLDYIYGVQRAYDYLKN